MNLPTVLLALRWLVLDTFRQSLASGILWLMLAVTGLCILFCLSAGVVGDVNPRWAPDEPPELLPRGAADAAQAKREGVDVVSGELTLAFGLVRIPLARGRVEAVRQLQLLLAVGVADVAGLLLTLIWTAGFLPTFLEPHAVSVLLAKPVPRWSLLLGKFLGVVAFVLAQASLFVGGTWLALGLRTGVWEKAYLLCILMLLLHFTIFFSVSALIAVWTRSTVACVFGTLVFWFLCWGMNYGRHALVALEPAPGEVVSAQQPPLQTLSPLVRWSAEAGYWALPKPADLGILLYHAMHAEGLTRELNVFRAVEQRGEFFPQLSVLASVLFTVAVLAVAGHQFVTMDY
jgi:hypothetical protein